MGHSAGGHLGGGPGRAAPGAPGAGPLVPVAAVISLAGVVDLVTGAHDGIGNHVVTEP
jgi:hypothetical protein